MALEGREVEPTFDHTTVVEYPVPTLQVSVKEVPLATEPVVMDDVTDGVTVMRGEEDVRKWCGNIAHSHEIMMMVRGEDIELELTYPHT